MGWYGSTLVEYYKPIKKDLATKVDIQFYGSFLRKLKARGTPEY